VIPAIRASIAAILVVTAETAPMAVILIVEDDAFIRDDAEMMIQDWGYDILSASDVDEALSLLRSPQEIDALFTDIYLKRAVLGGYELAHQAVNLRRNLRVLYTTGNIIDDQMKTMFVEGAHFLQKPYTQHQLRHSVEILLAA
jgi:CheY-like chemotaxis protein